MQKDFPISFAELFPSTVTLVYVYAYGVGTLTLLPKQLTTKTRPGTPPKLPTTKKRRHEAVLTISVWDAIGDLQSGIHGLSTFENFKKKAFFGQQIVIFMKNHEKQ